MKRLLALFCLFSAAHLAHAAPFTSVCANVGDSGERVECLKAELANTKLPLQQYVDAAGGDLELGAKQLMFDLAVHVETTLGTQGNYYRSNQFPHVNFDIELRLNNPCATYLRGTAAQQQSCLSTGVVSATLESLAVGMCFAVSQEPVVLVGGTCSAVSGIFLPYLGHPAAAIPVIIDESSFPICNSSIALHPGAPVATGGVQGYACADGTILPG